MDNEAGRTAQIAALQSRQDAVVDKLRDAKSQTEAVGQMPVAVAAEAITADPNAYIRTREAAGSLQQASADLDRATNAQQDVLDLQSEAQTKAAAQAERHEQQRASFFGLGKLFGESRREDAAATTSLRLGSIDHALKETTDMRVAAESAASTATTNFTEAVQAAPARIDTLIDANRRPLVGDPTEKMGVALEHQDDTAARVKFYAESGFDYDPSRMLPLAEITRMTERKREEIFEPVVRDTSARIAYLETFIAEVGDGHFQAGLAKHELETIRQRVSYSAQRAEAEGREMAVTATGFYDLAIRYAEGKGIQINQEALVDAIQRGTNISSLKERVAAQKPPRSSKLLIEFVRDRIAADVESQPSRYYQGETPEVVAITAIDRSASSESNYAAGCFFLEGLAKKYNLPTDETLIPYAIALIGGLMAGKSEYDVQKTLRNIIYDLSTPTEGGKPRLGQSIRIGEFNPRTIENRPVRLATGVNADESLEPGLRAANQATIAILKDNIVYRCLRVEDGTPDYQRQFQIDPFRLNGPQ